MKPPGAAVPLHRRILALPLRREALTFLLAGFSNWAITYLIYLAALRWLPYAAAFTLAFAIGILYSAVLYSRVVFRSRLTAARLGGYALFYLLSYLAGLGLLALAVDGIGVPERIALLVTTAIMVPVNFLGARLVLRRR